jgi:O-antigen/teichoic acid export membrane protein
MMADAVARGLEWLRRSGERWSDTKVPMKLPAVARLLQANVLLAAASFVTSVLLARTLEPEMRGVLANVILWPQFLSHIAMWGVPLYLSREMASRPEHAAAYYRQGYAALGVTTLVAIAIYCGLLWLGGVAVVSGSSLGLTGAMFAVLIIPFSAWNALQVQMELGRKSIGTYTFARGSFTAVHLVLVAGLVLAGSHDPETYLWAFIAAAVVAAVATHWLVNGALVKLSPVPAHGETVIQTFRASAPFALSIALIALSGSADRIAISLFFDAHALGVYVVALALSQVQSVVNEAISPLFFTSMAQKDHAAQTEPGWLAQRLRQSMLVNAAICAALIVAAPVLVPLIYGRAYEPALPIVTLLLPAMCARAMMRPFEEVLKGMNRPLSQSLAISAITGVFFAGAAVAAWFGSVLGVVAALLLASLTGLAIVAVLVSRACDIGLNQLLVPKLGDIVDLFAQLRRLLGI